MRIEAKVWRRNIPNTSRANQIGPETQATTFLDMPLVFSFGEIIFLQSKLFVELYR